MSTTTMTYSQHVKRSIKEIALDLLQRAMAFPNRICHRRRDVDHVRSIARAFKSPFTMSSELLNMFTKDPDFTKIIPVHELPAVLEIGTDGWELRANLYPVDREYEKTPYDPSWPTSGVFRFLIEENGSVSLIRRSTADVRYDPNDVIYSYASLMGDEERSFIRARFC